MAVLTRRRFLAVAAVVATVAASKPPKPLYPSEGLYPAEDLYPEG